MINKNERQKLASAASEIRKKAYAPYSSFRVGASLLSDDGGISGGVNVESSSYGLSVCAERNAIASALAKGKRKFLALAISSRGAADAVRRLPSGHS
ncbi:MAG: cytidine deaminase [Candidatus Marinimicrobia bacterium]|nr:cytidine deaminase [Candidatus Neomarinimicrobiota bacterium]